MSSVTECQSSAHQRSVGLVRRIELEILLSGDGRSISEKQYGREQHGYGEFSSATHRNAGRGRDTVSDGQTQGVTAEEGIRAEAEEATAATPLGATRLGREPMECTVCSTGRARNASRAMHVVVPHNRGVIVIGGR